MSTEFDPYHKWLGIPPDQQPPNHYRLLGIAEFESDLEVIGAAADRQMAHLRTKSSGAYGDLSQRLLNEVAQAKIVLLNEDKRVEYDKSIKGPPVAQPEQDIPAINVGGPRIDINAGGGRGNGGQLDAGVKLPKSTKPRSKASSSKKNILIIQNTIAIGLAIVALVSLWLLYPVIAGNGNDDEGDKTADGTNGQTNAGNNKDNNKKGNGSNKSNGNQNGGNDQNTTNNQNSNSNLNQKAKIIVDLRATGGKKVSVLANQKRFEVSNDGHHTLEVDAGTTHLVLKRDGYESASKDFDLNPGQTDSWSPRWKPSSSIIIDSEGEDIQVTIDGEIILPSDIEDQPNGSKQIFLVPGEHEVQVERRDYESIVATFSLSDREDKYINPTWTKKTSALDNSSTNAVTGGVTDRDRNYANYTEHWPLALTEYGSAPQGSSGSKLAVPSTSEIKSMTAKLNESIPDFRRLDAIRQLSQLSHSCRMARIETGPIAKYCMLDICREKAIELSQPAVAAWMIDHMEHWYKIDSGRYRKMRIDAIDDATKKIVDPQHISETLNLVRKMFADIQYRDEMDELLNIVKRMRAPAKRLKADLVSKDVEDDLTHLTMADWLIDYELDADDQAPPFVTRMFASDSFKNGVLFEQWEAFIEEFKNADAEGGDENQAKLTEIVKRISSTEFENMADIELADLFWEFAEPVKLAEPNFALKTAARYWYLRSAKAVPMDRVREVNTRFLETSFANAPPGNQPAIWVEMFDEQGWRRATELSGEVAVVGEGIEFKNQAGVNFGQFPVPAFVLEFTPKFGGAKQSLDVVIGGRKYRRIRLDLSSDQSQLNATVGGNNGVSDLSETTESTSWMPGSTVQFFVRPGEIDLCVNYKLVRSVPFTSEPANVRIGTQEQTEVTISAALIRRWTPLDQALTGFVAPIFRHDCDVALAMFRQYQRMHAIHEDQNRRGMSPQTNGMIHATLQPIVTNRSFRDLDSQGQPRDIRIKDNFWITEYEITQRQWNLVMGTNPSLSRGSPYLPIDQVSYNEVAEFCKRLTAAALKQKLATSKGIPDGFVYRLPTEAEWQYACRYHFREFPNAGLENAQSDRDFWYQQTSGGQMRQVGSYTDVRRRVYDMQGNVSEWVLDAWNDQQNWSGGARSPFVLPKAADNWIVVRGGAWWNDPVDCFERSRDWQEPVGAVGRGFRIILGKPPGN